MLLLWAGLLWVEHLGLITIVGVLTAVGLGTVLSGTLVFKAGVEELREIMKYQSENIRNANISTERGSDKHDNEIAYVVPLGKHAKKFKSMDGQQLLFVSWDMETGEGRACWKRNMKFCNGFKGLFMSCAWDGHHMPNGTVVLRLPKVQGEVTAYWYMPG